MTAMDSGPAGRLRDLPPHAPAPRSDVLLGDPAAAAGDPAGDARALRVRAHRRPAGGRAAPPADARRRAAARWTRGRPSCRPAAAPGARPTRWWARWSTPRAGTTCRWTSSAPTCARCGSTARRCGSAAGRSCAATWTARPAPWAGSWRRCSASRPTTAPTTGGWGRRSSSPTSSATWARTGGWTASTSRRRTASASGCPSRISRRAPPRPSCGRWSSTRWAAPAALFAGAAPAVAAAPPSVRPGVRLACAVYESVLDRVEAVGFDVLGRRLGVRVRRLPMLVWGALRP